MSTKTNTEKLKKETLSSKEFIERNSLLTDLYKIRHIKSLYNICAMILICLLINSIAEEYVTKGRVSVGLHIIFAAFSNFHGALLIWMLMLPLVFLSYIGMKVWANVVRKIPLKSYKLRAWNKFCLAVLIFYYISIIIILTYIIRKFDQPFASSMGLLMEVTRFLMKIHAFVRSNVPVVLNYKPHSEQTFFLPNFGNFFYFLFVPTLVYRDTYPRKDNIRWRFVLSCFLEVILAIFYMAFLLEKFFMLPFENFCLTQTHWPTVIVQILINSAPGLLMLLCSFYLFLHAWLNGFAEITKFGDRLFYKDWWNSNSYGSYFRTWNVVVHDWLYTYIYKDMYEIVTPKNKHMAKFVVFLVSAVFHEYILSFSFKMFLPVMFVQFFIFGTLFTLIRDYSFGNIFLWYSFGLGISIMISTYSIELYARHNCPVQNVTTLSYFTPQFLTCTCIL